MRKFTIAALQIGSDYQGKQATLANVLAFEDRILASEAKLVVMPEALLGGYPKGETFGARLGFRMPEGREAFAQYYANAINLDGPEIKALSDLSTRTGATLVVGVIERAGSSLFCTAVFIQPGRELVAHHRKLMPTGTERLIWSQGDGSTMPVVASDLGALGAAICWEKTTCRSFVPPCTPKASRFGARRPSTSVISGEARCARSPMRGDALSSAAVRCNPRRRRGECQKGRSQSGWRRFKGQFCSTNRFQGQPRKAAP